MLFLRRAHVAAQLTVQQGGTGPGRSVRVMVCLTSKRDRGAIMIAASEVLYEVDQGVAVLTFNRPEANNGQTESMEQLYLELLAKADDDPDVRVIVVTGAGRTFCVGGDMEYAQAVVRAGGWNKEIPHAQETYAL